jgi:threonine synthase
MVAVQSDGCAPIPRAFDAGQRFAAPWSDARTCASGLRVPAAVGDFMILDAVRESGGWAVAVPESWIIESMCRATSLEGIGFCPEAATCLLAVEQLVADGRMDSAHRVVIFNTGAAAKYTETVPLHLPIIEDPNNVDFARFTAT